jgi:hypothetical protein
MLIWLEAVTLQAHELMIWLRIVLVIRFVVVFVRNIQAEITFACIATAMGLIKPRFVGLHDQAIGLA